MYINPNFDYILNRLEGTKRSGDSGEIAAICPCAERHAHGDRKQSFHIKEDSEGRILFNCKTGCSQESLLGALGLTWADLAAPNVPYSRKGSDWPRISRPQPIRKQRREKSKTPAELEKILADLESDPDCRRGVVRYARRLGLPADLLWDIGCRWKRIEVYPRNPNDPGELWYPERDGSGAIVGIGIRSWDNNKCFVTGSHRGLLFSPGILARGGPVYLVEGLTDTVALLSLGLCVIGRPSNKGGLTDLAKLLLGLVKSREIIVIGENDKKSDQHWPGREGAEQTARELANLLNRSVKAALLPPAFKDSREWFLAPHSTKENLAAVYQQSLTVFASFPLSVTDVTEEEIEAAIIPHTRFNESPYAYPDELCPRPRHQLHKHKETHMLREQLVRCGCNSCPQCFKRKKRLRHESLCRHMAATKEGGGQLYCGIHVLDKKQWDTMRKSILSGDGQFIRYRHVGDRFTIIASAPFDGCRSLSFAESEKFAENALANSVCERKGTSFFSSSKAWAMEREKTEKQYQKLGTIHMPPQAVRRLCDQQLGKGKIKQTRPPDSDMLLSASIEYAAPDGENDAFVKMLLSKDFSEVPVFNTNDSDAWPPKDYGIRCLPAGFDEYFAWYLDPTG